MGCFGSGRSFGAGAVAPLKVFRQLFFRALQYSAGQMAYSMP